MNCYFFVEYFFKNHWVGLLFAMTNERKHVGGLRFLIGTYLMHGF